jgi:osmotically inducible protein OsmC
MRPRSAVAEWKGNLQEGEGTMSVASGVLEGASYSYESRFEEGAGSNPEELIAASHAGCFSMALASILSESGHEPRSVRTTARVRLEATDAGPTITRSDLETEVSVDGVEGEEFQRFAEQAKEGCAVSRALGAIELGLEARLV